MSRALQLEAVQTRVSRLTDEDLYLFNEGTHTRLHEKLGAHPMTVHGVSGTYFAVWAPDAEAVWVVGDFNGWELVAGGRLEPRASSGIWEGFVPGAEKGARYKFQVSSKHLGYSIDKTDPFAFLCEVPPKTASVIWDLDYQWGDDEWMRERGRHNSLDSPMAIYEVHLGSWRRVPEDGNRWLSYRELAYYLPDYCCDMGFTHVEVLPVMEHPLYRSWGYQTTGYFAPTSRYGNPQDFMFLVDRLHQRGIGVILDWVASHFPTDGHALGYFDGTHLYEHHDPRQGFHPDWGTFIFNYGRNEVRSFLLSSAMHWLSTFHADGLRVDAVASMLYLDYGRGGAEWVPNCYGGRENLEAIGFLRRLNEDAYRTFPDVAVIAEESTAWPMVSRPTSAGGLGFGLKWDMGWMHDTLRYLSHDPLYRSHHHNDLTFRMLYAFHENFVLPLSHDEVVHGKGSLLGRMPGDDWQRYANLRVLFGYMYAQAGKKLLFMGAEIAQVPEWNHESSLEWDVLQYPLHAGAQRWVRDLNRTYVAEPALHELDCDPSGFEWVEPNDSHNSVVSLIRKARSCEDLFLAVANFTPVPHHGYLVGVPRGGLWREVLNSDAVEYGGSGVGNRGGVEALPSGAHGRPCSLELVVPPLGCLFFKSTPESQT